jgi:hypothetical protein
MIECRQDVYGHPCQRADGHDGPCINHFQMRALNEKASAEAVPLVLEQAA